jgi:tetratricopeptide (TPR) repeat protein
LIEDASVVGKTFTKAALAAVAELSVAELDPLLSGLIAKELLTVQMDPRSPERGQHGFLQDLVRTVAYETLAKRDRKEKHLRVARYLERAWGGDEEEIVEVVASHYLDAYELAPDADDAAEVKDRARGMLVRAAEKAASLAAAEEAATYFEQAAALTPSPLERAELVERQGQMTQLRGRLDEAGATYEEASSLFERAGQSHAAARVQARLAEIEFARDHLEQAIERMTRSHEVLAGDEPDPDLAMVAAQLGRVLALAGRHAEAAPLLEEALELAEQLELPEVFAQALASKALSIVYASRLDEGATLLRRSLKVALEHDLHAAALRALNNLGYVMEARDRFADELAYAEQALEIARRTGDRGNELAVLTGTAYGRFATGDWDGAVSSVAEAQDAEELSTIEWAAAGMTDLIPLHVHRGQLGEARALTDRFSSLLDSDNLELASMYRVVKAELQLAEGDPTAASETVAPVVDAAPRFGLTAQLVKRAIRLAIEAALELKDLERASDVLAIVENAKPGQVTPYLRGHAARLAARLAAIRGDHQSAEPGFEASASIFRDAGLPFDLAVVLLERAEWLARQDHVEEAAPPFEEAREIFERLGARPWIDRLERLTASVEAVRTDSSV